MLCWCGASAYDGLSRSSSLCSCRNGPATPLLCRPTDCPTTCAIRKFIALPPCWSSSCLCKGLSDCAIYRQREMRSNKNFNPVPFTTLFASSPRNSELLFEFLCYECPSFCTEFRYKLHDSIILLNYTLSIFLSLTYCCQSFLDVGLGLRLHFLGDLCRDSEISNSTYLPSSLASDSVTVRSET